MSQSAGIDSTKRYQAVTSNKANGETYTPLELADFVAYHICRYHQFLDSGTLRVLDPSIGDGELSLSLLKEIRKFYQGKVELFAFDTNATALSKSHSRIASRYPDCMLRFENKDFLQFAIEGDCQPDLLTVRGSQEKPKFDLIIANPPYVRTQIMGASEAQRLASTFGLTGRVDLYQAFLLAMAKVLAPNGTAGFIVSNRFMTTRGGAALRRELRKTLKLREVWDLGDTKLFDAAVLPAVIIANGSKVQNNQDTAVPFTSIYETKEHAELQVESPIQALVTTGVIAVGDGRRFMVKSGILDNSDGSDAVWRVATATGNTWLATVEKHTARTFGEIGKIRVGVKTCADKVFIRHDWEGITKGELPELLRPLITHHSAGRYRATVPKKTRHILYPHTAVDGKRMVIDLDDYPKSKAYLEANRPVLEGRTYVIEGGRKWYEIWVPQNPSCWSCPKLVFRDISERPTFWLDLEGGVVNGDCYWMVAENGHEAEWLWLAAAVANSTLIETFYDHRFNNKLYAGRRRFITQYVQQFPLPDIHSLVAQEIIKKAKAIYEANHSAAAEDMERELDKLVWQAFGLGEEIRR